MGLVLLSSAMLTACAAGDTDSSGGESDTARSPVGTERPAETTRRAEPPPETSGRPEQPQPGKTRPEKRGKAGGLNVEQLTSEAPGQGPERPQVLLASSASGLSGAAGVRVPDAGRGTYLAAFWGEKPTGGYSLEILSARAGGNRVTVRLSLTKPPEGAIVTQALTYPYAAAVVRDEDLAEKEFLLEDQRGRRLDWPVRLAREGG